MEHISLEQYHQLTKGSKYRSKRLEVDGITFDSKAEAKRYEELKLLETIKEITDLMLQVRFPLLVNGVKVADYVADFVYVQNGRKVIEDCKGVKTPVYRLKKRLMKAIYDIDILET